MINLHLNGDIIRCPDVGAIKQKMKRTRDKLKICQFAVQEEFCPQWSKAVNLNPKENLNRRCDLCTKFKIFIDIKSNEERRVYECDKANERYLNGLKPKNFQIDNSTYRKVSSAAHYLIKTTKTRTLFLLLTFPPWKKNFNPYKNEKKLNECFSKFVENLHNNYGCEGYIAARELGKQTRRYHYHFLCSIPYHSFFDLNNAWNSAISDICEYSNSALKSKKENRLLKIGDTVRAVKYICKYVSKCKNQSSQSRLIFISNNLFCKPVGIRNYEYSLFNKTGVMNLETYLLKYKSLQVTKLNDYCTAFRINNDTDLKTINNEIIYPMFHLPPGENADFYAFPLAYP